MLFWGGAAKKILPGAPVLLANPEGWLVRLADKFTKYKVEAIAEAHIIIDKLRFPRG